MSVTIYDFTAQYYMMLLSLPHKSLCICYGVVINLYDLGLLSDGIRFMIRLVKISLSPSHTHMHAHTYNPGDIIYQLLTTEENSLKMESK